VHFILTLNTINELKRIFLFSFLELFIKQQSEFYVDHPEKVDGNGKLISYSLSHHFRRHKRDLNSAERRVFYKLNYKGQEFTLNLTTNDNLLSNEYVLKKHNRSLTEKRSQTSGNLACHLIGTVMDGNEQGTAAISTCEGLNYLYTIILVNILTWLLFFYIFSLQFNFSLCFNNFVCFLNIYHY
uniref:Peptidase M12B propeptide domain-containing protein n=1 Tax=Sinocyclocheilus anshuiensis TaxID=1608454 RepID=A0A671M4S6_9TELE